jgi:hypothetical protein
MDFRELEEFQRIVRQLQKYHVVSLKHYHLHNSYGFQHLYSESTKNTGDFSKASTATCILSLTSSGCWTSDEDWYTKTEKLIEELAITDWTSAKLEKNNPFTVSFILESILALLDIKPEVINNVIVKQKKEKAIRILKKSLRSDKNNKADGAAKLANYPPSSYLTQLVVRVLKKCNQLDEDTRICVRQWSWRQIEHELALIISNSKSADPLSLAYSVMLFVSCTKSFESTPDENQILHRAIDCVFESQLPDGSWPRSRPLFHYPKVGNAYCFEYEMLTQFLQEKFLFEHSLNHIEHLYLTARKLKEFSFEFEGGGLGWASGHHPQIQGPESWSTASVYHFLHVLDRVIAEAIRREVFKYVGAEYLPLGDCKKNESDFCINFWDSDIFLSDKQSLSLKTTLFEKLVKPISEHLADIENGHDLPKSVPISAVFFGPPGTSKTELAKEISKYLNWPLLAIDPSHLVKEGLDNVQAETNSVFNMLSKLEQCVVLLDEFDEMLRERTSAHSETLSRFLTTAMLPKLSQINEHRRIIFIVATNHIDQFDFAIKRPGRFDLIIQVMPPTVKSKLEACPEIGNLLEKYNISKEKIKNYLEPLTYLEFLNLVKSSENVHNEKDAMKLITQSKEKCTLMQKINEKENWKTECNNQIKYIRIPN